jgi:hypothetical protein
VRKRVTLRISKGLRAVALAAGISRRVYSDTRVIFITIYIVLAEKIGTPLITLTHESPTLFLNSPIYTLEEKFAYVEKYLCGLQLPCVQNPHCHYDLNNKNSTINYFERGKHANEYNDNYNDSLHKQTCML